MHRPPPDHAMPAAPARARTPHVPRAPHALCGTRLARFERLLARFRDHLLAALQGEPDGPDRHLRAYVRCVRGLALQPHACRRRWALLLGSPPCTAIWREFADEACAGDAVDPARSRACRQAAEELWYNLALASTPCAPTGHPTADHPTTHFHTA